MDQEIVARIDFQPIARADEGGGGALLYQQRKVWIDPAHGWHDVPVYDGAELRPGCRLDGPLLIEERTTTAFVGPRDLLEVDERDDFLVHIDAQAAAREAAQ